MDTQKNRLNAGIIVEPNREKLADVSAKNLIEIGLMGEKSNRKM